MRIEEVKRHNKVFKVSPHSHIKSLGLGMDGRVDNDCNTIVGQEMAREVY